MNNSNASHPLVWPYGTGVVAINIAGFFGNVLVVLCVKQSTIFRKKPFWQMVTHLAFNNIFFNLSSMVRGLFTFWPLPPMKSAWCLLVCSPTLITYPIGNALILFICLDRLWTIVRPLQHRALKKWQKWIMIAISHLFGYVTVSIAWSFLDQKRIIPQCTIGPALLGFPANFWTISNEVVFVLICILYPIFYWKLRAQKRAALNMNIDAQTVDENYKFLKTFLYIPLIYLLSGVAVQSLLSLSHFLANSKPTLAFYLELYSSIWANVTASCDFFVFVWRSQDFRSELKKLWAKFRVANSAVSDMPS